MATDDDAHCSARMQPEQRVGAVMREARELRGISLRQLAKRLGYHSHTTLSAYERGTVMPTDEAVEGYEQVLGLKPKTLANVLEAARVERHGDAWAKRRVHLPVEFADRRSEPPDAAHGTGRPRWSRSRWTLIAIGALVLGLIAFVIVDLLPTHRKPVHAAVSPVVGVRDGSDPNVTGCAADAVTADSVDVYSPPEHLAGTLQLRTSVRCGTSWARFVPSSALSTRPPLTLEIDVYRPADGGVAKFHVTYDGLTAYGNMLISRNECVYAQLTLLHKGQSNPAPVQTACRKTPS